LPGREFKAGAFRHALQNGGRGKEKVPHAGGEWWGYARHQKCVEGESQLLEAVTC